MWACFPPWACRTSPPLTPLFSPRSRHPAAVLLVPPPRLEEHLRPHDHTHVVRLWHLVERYQRPPAALQVRYQWHFSWRRLENNPLMRPVSNSVFILSSTSRALGTPVSHVPLSISFELNHSSIFPTISTRVSIPKSGLATGVATACILPSLCSN